MYKDKPIHLHTTAATTVTRRQEDIPEWANNLKVLLHLVPATLITVLFHQWLSQNNLVMARLEKVERWARNSARSWVMQQSSELVLLLVAILSTPSFR